MNKVNQKTLFVIGFRIINDVVDMPPGFIKKHRSPDVSGEKEV
jgi:hypothetical protein